MRGRKSDRLLLRFRSCTLYFPLETPQTANTNMLRYHCAYSHASNTPVLRPGSGAGQTKSIVTGIRHTSGMMSHTMFLFLILTLTGTSMTTSQPKTKTTLPSLRETDDSDPNAATFAREVAALTRNKCAPCPAPWAGPTRGPRSRPPRPAPSRRGPRTWKRRKRERGRERDERAW